MEIYLQVMARFRYSESEALTACPKCEHSFRCSGVSGVGFSLAGTELHRIVSSKPGAEKMKTTPTGSVPVFFMLTQVFEGMNTMPPACTSLS